MLRLLYCHTFAIQLHLRMNEKVSTASDRAGITSAVLCTIHCLVIPVLFLLKFSFTDSSPLNLPSWWEQLDYVFLLVSFLAVYHSANHTPTRQIKISLWVFWAILAISIIFQAHLHWMAYIASAGLVITHFINIRNIKKGMRLK